MSTLVALPWLATCCRFWAMRSSSADPPPVAATASPRARMVLRLYSAFSPAEMRYSLDLTSVAVSKGVRAASACMEAKAALAFSASPSRLVRAVLYFSISAL